MHHVVADLHVLDDLGVRECGDTDDERDRIEAKANHRATGDRAAARTTDHVTDVRDVFFAKRAHHLVADGVEVGLQRDGIFAAETFAVQYAHVQRSSSRSLRGVLRSEEHTSELQSLMRISYAVFCLK